MTLPASLEFSKSVWSSTIRRVVFFSIWAAVIVLYGDKEIMSGSHSDWITSINASILFNTTKYLAFNHSNSINRWQDGRNLWSNIQSSTRSFLRLSSSIFDRNSDTAYDNTIEEFIGLILSFPVALKYHLRNKEFRGLEEHDLRVLLPRGYLASLKKSFPTRVHFEASPSPQPPSRSSSLASHREKDKEFKTPTVVRNVNFMDLDPLNDVRRRPSYETSELEKQHEQLNIKESDENLSVPRSVLSNSRPSNIPLSVLRLLQVYLNGFYNNRPERRNDNMKTHIDTPLFVNMIGYLKELTDLMTQAEKIRDTPIPLIISIHLNQVLALYLLAIPPQLVSSLGWMSIPITGLVTFFFCGIDAISSELSEPFGSDLNDLPIDKYCLDIIKEAQDIGGYASSVSRNALGDGLANKPSSSFKPTPVRGSDWKPSCFVF
ncbi:UPF0187-domain-containing protein [Wallemia mellicola]|nr:hypothetical protein E3Q24_02330 [Wallemia mellicola]TIB83799.1 UPF0187-domain-containing protein [Wallemia mellicola]TIB86822.1 UPF0187-domain-containing protein [Wallemia mellicola]TIC22526.1 UPF0187-domain-containing protein [Wallemia mellicola]TIC39751.1 UPF0187-domain-containing protein [Wallemia mellicola]